MPRDSGELDFQGGPTGALGEWIPRPRRRMNRRRSPPAARLEDQRMEPTPPRRAFGAPGIEPRWARSDKAAVGTAYFAGSRIWFTLAGGITSEVYYPTIDRPQIRDLQYLATDGATFFHDERRPLSFSTGRPTSGTLFTTRWLGPRRWASRSSICRLSEGSGCRSVSPFAGPRRIAGKAATTRLTSEGPDRAAR